MYILKHTNICPWLYGASRSEGKVHGTDVLFLTLLHDVTAITMWLSRRLPVDLVIKLVLDLVFIKMNKCVKVQCIVVSGIYW